jgi:tetratricopeptide (TPR) repeat protein
MALYLDPKLTAAYVYRGKVSQEQGNLHGAISDYSHAIRVAPFEAYAYLLRSEARQLIGDENGSARDDAHYTRLKPYKMMDVQVNS